MAALPMPHLHAVHFTHAVRVHGLKLTALEYPNYRLFWVGQLVTNVGSWMQIVATGWLVDQLTHSAANLGFNAAFQALPIIFFSLIGGGISDRVDPYPPRGGTAP